MSKFKKQIKLSYKVEMIGAGYYRGLAGQYSKKEPEIVRHLLEFGDNEYSHGEMFKKCYRDSFGKDLSGEKFWIAMGKFFTYVLYLMPLKSKLKSLASIEHLAVKMIEKDIASGVADPYVDIIKKILPDEKAHAAIYREWNWK